MTTTRRAAPSDAELNATAASLHWRRIGLFDGRGEYPAEFALLDGGPEVEEIFRRWPPLIAVPLERSMSVQDTVRLADPRWLPVEEVEEVPGAGPIFRLLLAFGLRRAVDVSWLLSPGNPRYSALWHAAGPHDRWLLQAEHGEGGQPGGIDLVDRLIVARPAGMTDRELLATAAGRAELRRIVDRNRLPDRGDADRVVNALADGIRTLEEES